MIDLKKLQVRTETKANSNVESVKVTADKVIITMKRSEAEYENKKGGKGLQITAAGSRFGAEAVALDLGGGDVIPGKINVFISVPLKDK
jgi:hypothetical protein